MTAREFRQLLGLLIPSLNLIENADEFKQEFPEYWSGRFTRHGRELIRLERNGLDVCDMPGGVLIEHRDRFTSDPTAIFADGDRLLVREMSTSTFDVVQWRTLDVETRVTSSMVPSTRELILAPDETWFVTRSRTQCAAWRLSDGHCLWALPPQRAEVRAYECAAISPDGAWVAVGCGPRILVVDSTTGKVFRRFAADRSWPPSSANEPAWLHWLPSFRIKVRKVRRIAFTGNDLLLVGYWNRGPTDWKRSLRAPAEATRSASRQTVATPPPTVASGT